MGCSTCGGGNANQTPTLTRSQMMDLAGKIADKLEGDQVEVREVIAMAQTLASTSKDVNDIVTKAQDVLQFIPKTITSNELRQLMSMAQQAASIGR